MSAPRYQKRHLSKDGIWRVCRASVRECGFEKHRAGSEFSHLRTMTANGHSVKRSSSAELSFELLGNSVADWAPMSDESDGPLRVAPEGMSGKWCEVCGAYLTSVALSEVASDDTLDCPNCEETLRVNEMPVDFCADQLRFTDDDVVRSSHWFHVSANPNWDAATKAGKVVTHLGSKLAAMERMAQLLAQGMSGNKRFYLHEVVLDSTVEVKPGIWNDQVDWPKEVGITHFEEDGEVGVHRSEVLRYMNSYEAPGTVSLMADPGSYRLIASATLPLTDRKGS